MRLRIAIGAAGILLGLFGVFRLLTEIPSADLFVLVVWLVGALVLHDGILSPLVVGVGYAISTVVPPRARRYLQTALIVGASITVIALPMIHREGSQPPNKAILQQNYVGNLTLVLGIITALAVLAYAVRYLRDRTGQRPSAVKERPPEDQSSLTS
jgi:hypothetical protein